MRTRPLPLEFPGIHHMDQREIDAVTRVLTAQSPFRFYGMNAPREAKTFEQEFAAFTGARHALAVSSGTGALHTAVAALGAGPGREVIVPAYGWVSVIAAVVHAGAVPVIADIDDSFCLDPVAVERLITPATAGIVLVHMSGAPGDATAIRDVTARHGIWMLEDCAQCAGGTIGGRSVGTFGDAGIFSFQMNKNMTSGEGGAVISNDTRIYRRAVACHDLGYPRDDVTGRMTFDDPELHLWGRGYRIDEMRAAVLRVQLTKLPAIVECMRGSKRRIRERLQAFANVCKLRRLIDCEGDTGPFLITTYRDAATAKWVCQALRAEGIVPETGGVSNIVMTDWGLHLYYNHLSLVRRTGLAWQLAENQPLVHSYAKGTCPVADGLYERSVLLAIPSCLSEQDERDIIEAFEKVLGAL